jgi:hypothetical protein
MNAYDDPGQSAETQLRQAWGGIASIVDDMLRRNREIGDALTDAQERQRTETERLAAMERAIASDRAALEQMNTVFSSAAGQTKTPQAHPPGETAGSGRRLHERPQTHELMSEPPARTLTSDMRLDRAPAEVGAIDQSRSALTVADFLALEAKRDEA